MEISASPQAAASLVYGNEILLLLGMSGALLSGYLLKAGKPVSRHISAGKSQPKKQVNFPF